MGQQSCRSAADVRDQGGCVQLEQKVTLTVTRGRIVIEPSSRSEYDLAQLVDGITAKNVHTEVSFGKPVGKEAL